ncbi:NAD-dependent epimerase/dehydratase family protein [Candidatus Mycobacterium wuenschmannii]|uniref:NAD-dependent epimerase/dehydratase family protein n=1 Tax=Candidatus Mycobacterium wuenschmannii TaxID=3027808 RepID=A0ABY8VVD4_9MYCO|nr:NAD-dependent epimerase/dehydratase family protein [Candidatus Mycobacterium wuenschmannii]WIM87618.1 NAD-dependent epimerase/dehydratase family protein [Candidatus Mycobacterium wuenschmannii]
MRDGFRLAITGATGDFGRAVLSWACGCDDIAEVTALGRRPTGLHHNKVREQFLDLSGDVDLESVRGYDALIHLAYCVEESHDKRWAHRVNVAATRALLAQAREVGIGQLVLTSSANALGVTACGTGQQYTETSYPAGDQDAGHYYFQHKALLEHLANWYWANIDDGKTTLAVVRPCYVVGEQFDNSGLQTMLSKTVVYPSPSRSYYQFLWDTDLVDAYATILSHGLGGLYNVAPADYTSVREICAITGARLIPGPLRLLKPGADLLFRLRLSPYSGHWVTLGDPLLDSGLLQSTTDWRPSMNSAAALRKYLTTRPN